MKTAVQGIVPAWENKTQAANWKRFSTGLGVQGGTRPAGRRGHLSILKECDSPNQKTQEERGGGT